MEPGPRPRTPDPRPLIMEGLGGDPTHQKTDDRSGPEVLKRFDEVFIRVDMPGNKLDSLLSAWPGRDLEAGVYGAQHVPGVDRATVWRRAIPRQVPPTAQDLLNVQDVPSAETAGAHGDVSGRRVAARQTPDVGGREASILRWWHRVVAVAAGEGPNAKAGRAPSPSAPLRPRALRKGKSAQASGVSLTWAREDSGLVTRNEVHGDGVPGLGRDPAFPYGAGPH